MQIANGLIEMCRKFYEIPLLQQFYLCSSVLRNKKFENPSAHLFSFFLKKKKETSLDVKFLTAFYMSLNEVSKSK